MKCPPEVTELNHNPTRKSRLARNLVGLGIVLGAIFGHETASMAAAPVASAPPHSVEMPKTPIGFSKLLIRMEGDDEIGLAKGEYRIMLLEHLRTRGLTAVGGENLVFDRDDSAKAAYVLGGTVKQVQCRQTMYRQGNCKLAVEWQVLDVDHDRVVYSVLSRASIFGVALGDARIGRVLLEAALDSLISRPKFRLAIAIDPSAERAIDPSFTPATLATCAVSSKKMPEAAEQLLHTAVVVKGRASFGSGFFVSPDGLVMTAAHVVDQAKVTLRLRDGTELEALPIRIARHRDVALLRPVRPITGQNCLAMNTGEPAVGAELYAVGTPADMSLAFSLTRGIVSGVRLLDGKKIIQTDAPVSPGNSGGPLMDSDGKVLALAYSKLSGRRVEGVAFGVPMSDALKALGLSSGKDTTPGLLSDPAAPLISLTEAPAVTDDPDGEVSLEPPPPPPPLPSAESRLHARQVARDNATPQSVKNIRTAGWVGLVAGATIGSYTYIKFKDSDPTRSEYSSLRTVNAVSWGVALGGLGAVIYGYAARPALADDVPPAPKTSLSIGPGSIELQGSF